MVRSDSMMKRLLLALIAAYSAFTSSVLAGVKPNIVLIMTDDQGYGDLGSTGNPVIKTPHLDVLASESLQLTDYHVAPTCSPTRCALLTGHWTNRAGAWHTINGRSMIRVNEVTLGQLFKDNGYQTGMFGKWHLGDNYPYRPEDRGFTEVYRHGGGGVGQTPDLWDNAYFDGRYFHNGKIVDAKGFCSDVFFDQGNDFIRDCVKKDEPFLAYIVTNAPHGPLHAPQKYLDMYKDQPSNLAAFYGMISNIDDNVGKTRALLKELGADKNTIFIFTTDNGTATGDKIFNAGMRGKKGSAYDGGHRVPFFVYWPEGKMAEKRHIPTLTHAVDVVPTLLDMAQASMPADLKFDGVSFKPVLEGKEWGFKDRFVVSDSQRVRDPIKWKDSSVMSQQYRLIKGAELYDIVQDPGQKKDIAAANPDQVAKMRAFYDAWWAELEPTFALTTEIYVGHPDHPMVSLTGHDWIQKSGPPWNQRHIRNAGVYGSKKLKNGATLKHQGHWAVKVIEAGYYSISVRRWPVEANVPITANLPAGEDVPGATKAFRAVEGKAVPISAATLRIDGKEIATKEVTSTATQITFTAELHAGSHQLAPIFHTDRGELGAFYTVVTKLN